MDQEGRKELTIEFGDEHVNFLVEDGSPVSLDEDHIKKLIGGLRGWLTWIEAGRPDLEEAPDAGDPH